ncbi:DUF222 domain-containing protein [Propioniciclava soli]|uniref:DUF222 domain-containing protein n=1 Tax=Propioniciclava soli TaxID=2775081 RepID=UPI001E422BEA|nr:DUF222 domain-containing protein [Propioniciclava soli]
MRSNVMSREASDNLAALDHAHQAQRSARVAELVCLARACDLHAVDATVIVDGAERLVSLGGDGTPLVGEFLAAEVGALLGISPASAKRRLGQALNLRHRHPRLWELTMQDLVDPRDALMVVDACVDAGLSGDACAFVDRQCAIAAALQPLGRVLSQLPGWILAADPALARERAEQTARWRGVTVDPIVDGATGIHGRLDAGDGIALDDALTQLAGQLPAAIDPGTRRAASLGMLARHALGQEPLPPVDDTAALKVAGEVAENTLFSVDAAGEAHAVPPVGNPAVSEACGCGHAAFARLLGGTQPRPRDLVVHLDAAALADPASGVATVEGWGVVLAEQLGGLLSGSAVTVRPVLDPNTIGASDAYEVPERMRRWVEVRNPVDVFPWGTRRAGSCQQDHTVPFVAGLPAGHGQTRPDNLGPLSSFTHRARTHGGWRLAQPVEGVFCWESPAGYQYVVTADGSTRVRRPPPPEHAWWHAEPPAWQTEPDPPEWRDPREDTLALTA